MSKLKPNFIDPEMLRGRAAKKFPESKPNKVLSTISVIVVLFSLMSLFFIAGAIFSCEVSEGTFLPNLRCINKTALDYCLMPDEKIGYSPGGPRINQDWGIIK